MLPSTIKNFAKIISLVLVAFSLLMMQPLAYAENFDQGNPEDQTVGTPSGNSGTVNLDGQGTKAEPLDPDQNPNPALGQSTVKGIPTAAEMIANISKQLPSLFRLVTAIAYVMGIVFMIRGIMMLKHAGEMRTMMSQEHSMKGPIIYLAVGAALMYFPSSLQVGLTTFWKDPNPYSYVLEEDQWSVFIGTCLLVIQFFGVVAFIRGLVMLAQLAGHGGGHQGGLGKAMTHIIGGIFCINIYQFVQVIMVTLGIQSPI